ncbi:MAG TPA: restriction endonuclease [Gemmatimonadales bacterium]|nr:restriction endonuclease [Gemmatimonadales bacterium]HYT84745.1 restriction endonuclease [Gemmatimonadales bacterium]
MGELPKVTAAYFEILVVRELRKAGFEVSDVRVHRRAELPEPERGFIVELLALLARPPWHKRALIACRRQDAAVRREAVDALTGRLADAGAEVGLVFGTTEFAPDALAAGLAAGIPLCRIVDGRTAFDASGWGPPGHYPTWLPAYLAQVAQPDVAGQPRYRLLESGRVELILDRFEPGTPPR